MSATTKLKDVLTTGEVAKICNVAPRTVSKWFDTGALTGYRIPGSKDRRIPLAQLIKFMKQHGMPLNGLMTGCTRVLIVDDEQDIVEVLEKINPNAYRLRLPSHIHTADVFNVKHLFKHEPADDALSGFVDESSIREGT